MIDQFARVFGRGLVVIGLVASASAQDEGANRQHTRIRAPDGRPCLVFKQEARPEMIIKGTFDHLVHVRNSCPQRIKVTLCYQGAHDVCRRFALSAYGEETAMLGSMYNQPDFAFDYEEKDDN